MKLHEIKKGTRAVKAVPLRLATAPLLEPGVDWEGAEDGGTVLVGVRILTGEETRLAFEKAQEAALKGGVPQWLATHPLCQLHEMAQLVAFACVDNDSRDEPFFVGGAAEVLGEAAIGSDNIAYLAEQVKQWRDEVSPRGPDIGPEELMAAIVREAERPEEAPETFFSRLRPSTRERCIHSMAALLSSLLTSRSLTGLPSTDSPSTVPESSSAAEPVPPAPPNKKKRGKR